MKKIILFILIGFILLPCSVFAKEDNSDPFMIGADLEFVSQYHWRGSYYSQGAVWQPSLWVSKWGLTGYVWGNMPLTKEPNRGEFNEVDLGFEYEFEFKNFVIKPGYIHFFYPNTVFASSGEASLEVQYNHGSGFSMGLISAFDVKEYRGAYFGQLNLGYEKELASKFTFSSTLELGWASNRFNNGYYGVDDWAMNFVAMQLKGSYGITSWLSINPYLKYYIMIDSALRDAVNDPQPFVVGLVLSFEY